MEDLQTIHTVVDSAVKNSSYITVLISSGVFILYTIIIKTVEIVKSKNKSKPFIQMASAVKEIGENVAKLNQVLDKTIKNAEVKEDNKIENIIVTSFESFKNGIINHCIDVIIHNNVETHKDYIKQNLYKVITNEYYKLYAIFSDYEKNSVNLVTKLKESWITDIKAECLEIIFSKDDSLTRIRKLNNRLAMIAEEYSIYVKNKIFNN